MLEGVADPGFAIFKINSWPGSAVASSRRPHCSSGADADAQSPICRARSWRFPDRPARGALVDKERRGVLGDGDDSGSEAQRQSVWFPSFDRSSRGLRPREALEESRTRVRPHLGESFASLPSGLPSFGSAPMDCRCRWTPELRLGWPAPHRIS